MKTIRCQLLTLFCLLFLSLLSAQNKLVGISQEGEYQNAYSGGMIWEVSSDGTGFAVLKNWEIPASPSTLIRGTDENYYGATTVGGQNGSGYIFKMKADGSDFLPIFQTPVNVKIVSLLEGENGRLFGGAVKTNVYSKMIFSINPDGTGYTIHVDDPAIDAKFFNEGPDGKIYWFKDFNLWRMNHDGSEKTDLTSLFTLTFDMWTSEKHLKRLPNGNLWGWIDYSYLIACTDEVNRQLLFTLNADGSVAMTNTLFVYIHYSNMVAGNDNFIYSRNKKFDISNLTESPLPNMDDCLYTLQLGGTDGWLYGRAFDLNSGQLADLRAYNPVDGTCRVVIPAEQTGYKPEFCFEVSASTAVEQIAQEEIFALSPNPANSRLQVVTNAASGVRDWQIQSISGQLMSSGTTGSNAWEISVENLPRGTYLLTIREKVEPAFNKMFVKSK